MNRNGNTLTITGLALGEASITVTSGNAQTTIPIVVADKVLDVPHIRQEKSLWCWAACAQMVVKTYMPNDNTSQTAMARIGQQLEEGETPANEAENYLAIERIINTCTENAVSLIRKTNSDFTESNLRTQLNAGSPVIYLSTRYASNHENTGGHFRVIYGYYKLSENEYVYLVYDPWDTCMKYKENAIGNNVHLDIWRRSWENILDEKEEGISGLDIAVTSSYLTFYTREFIYFDLL